MTFMSYFYDPLDFIYQVISSYTLGVEDDKKTEMESSEELNSMCHVSASLLFPKPENVFIEDADLAVPFSLVSGEHILALGRTSDGVLALSNYRLYVQLGQGCYNLPLGQIEQLEVKEIFYLHIGCKDARSLSCAFSTNETCLDWYKRLHQITLPKKSIEDMFAFAFYAYTIEEGNEDNRLAKDATSFSATFNAEVERLKFNLHGTWRITQINKDYKTCPSYPPQLLVPACISDKILEAVAKFRSSRRIPAVVWRHTGNGAVIARSSQPEVGWLGWRSPEDENLLKALSDACSYDKGESTINDSPDDSEPKDEPVAPTVRKKVLIVDARSYTTAVANRARGGGCECPEYYSSCEIQFMSLANIHTIRKSFQALRHLCASDADQNNWLSLLEGTRWMQHMSGLLRAAVTVASAVERDGRPVLVHCSDGWDRTPQIVALAQILLDPYYRTIEGFQVLCEREWLDFGHKFADRCGQTVGGEDPNERCPVFLQWLDCVYQLTKQFKCSFQMSSAYLVKLAQHTYSQLFGTFLCNTRQERLHFRVRERSFSVWHFLNHSSFINHLYYPQTERVLWPSCNVRDLELWSEVYLGTAETPLGINDIAPRVPVIDIETNDNEEPQGHMTKTRSYGDLIQAQDHTTLLHRRLSDPNISIEKKFDSLNLDNEQEKVEVTNEQVNGNHIIVTHKVNGQIEETENKKNLLNGESESIEIPTITSGESSTDTLVANGDLIAACDNIEKESTLTNHVQKLENRVVEPASITCHNRIRNQNLNQGCDVSETSAPLASRTPSSIFPPSPIHQDMMADNSERLHDVDGLPLLYCDVQMRVQQLINENKLKEEALKKELHTTRLALINQVSNCNAVDSDRISEISSIPDSVGSTAEHGESVPSDMSWEALDEPGTPTLWVPDHAVNHCTGCKTEFWLGRRKHHCRCCGQIFCADCSENWTPLPSEQLYSPVRVCRDCFSSLNPANSRQSLEQQTLPQQPQPILSLRNGGEQLNDHPVPLPQPMMMACHRSARKGKDECCDSAFSQKTIVEPSIAN